MNNNVEKYWLFSKCKCQFRFSVTSRFASDKKELLCWQKLSEQYRSMWSWSVPGDHFVFNQIKDLSVISNKELSNKFAVLKIDITQVDQLFLHKLLI